MKTLLSRVLPMPAISLVIAALWLGLAPTANANNVILAVAVALIAPWATQALWPDRPRLRRPLRGLRLLIVVVADIVLANWQVARLVLGPRARLCPSFLDYRTNIDDPFVASVLCSIISLTPGTVAIDHDPELKTITIHALDAADPHALAAAIRRRYEQELKEVFGC
jgi:multicomponent K+:H+ antiporter subunit E